MSNTSSPVSEATISTASTTPLIEKKTPPNSTDLYRNFLSCPLCIERYTKPKLMPCLHSFCRGCLKEYIPPQATSMNCPLCSRSSAVPSNGVDGFGDNQFVAELLLRLDSQLLNNFLSNSPLSNSLSNNCNTGVPMDNTLNNTYDVTLNCNSSCIGDTTPIGITNGSSLSTDSHSINHFNKNNFSHKNLPPNNIPFDGSANPIHPPNTTNNPTSPNLSGKVTSNGRIPLRIEGEVRLVTFKCPLHQGSNMNLHCKDCDVLVCVLCGGHSSHDLQPLKNVSRTERILLRTTLEKVQIHLGPLDSSLRNITKTIDKLEKQTTEAQAEVENHFKLFSEALENRKKKLIAGLKVESDTKKVVLLKQRDDLARLRGTYRVSCEYLEDKFKVKRDSGRVENGGVGEKELDRLTRGGYNIVKDDEKDEEKDDEKTDDKTYDTNEDTNDDTNDDTNGDTNGDTNDDTNDDSVFLSHDDVKGGDDITKKCAETDEKDDNEDDNEDNDEDNDDVSLLILMAKREMERNYGTLLQNSLRYPPNNNPFITFDHAVISRLIRHIDPTNERDAKGGFKSMAANKNHGCDDDNSYNNTDTNTKIMSLHANTHTNKESNKVTHNNNNKHLSTTSTTTPSPTTPKTKKPSVNFDPSTKNRPETDHSQNGGVVVSNDNHHHGNVEDMDESVILRCVDEVGRVVSSHAVRQDTEAENIKNCYLNTPTKIMVSTRDFLGRNVTNDGVKLSAKIFNLTSFQSRSRESSTSRCASVSDRVSVDSNDNTLDNTSNHDNNDAHSVENEYDNSLNRSTFDVLTTKNINRMSEKLIRKKVLLVPKIIKIDAYSFEVSFVITDDLLKTIKKYEARLGAVMGVNGRWGGTCSSTPTKSLSTKTPPCISGFPLSNGPTSYLHSSHDRISNSTKDRNNTNKNKDKTHNKKEMYNQNNNNLNNNNINNLNGSYNTPSNSNNATRNKQRCTTPTAKPSNKSSSAQLVKRPSSALQQRTPTTTQQLTTPTTTTTQQLTTPTTTATLATFLLEINLFSQPIKNSPFLIRIKPQENATNIKNKNNNETRISLNNNNNKTRNNNNNNMNNTNTNKELSTQSSHNSVFSEPSPSCESINKLEVSSNPDSQSEDVKRIGSKGHAKGAFMNLQGISVFEDLIAVADSNSQKIQVFSTNGKCLLRFGVKGRSQGQLTRPTGVTFTRDGTHLVVSDYENKCVNLYEAANGKFVSKIGQGKLIGPKGVMVDGCDRLVVVDNKASVVWMFSLAGKLLGKFGSRSISNSTDEPGKVKVKPPSASSSSSSSSSFSESSLKLAGPHFCALDPNDGDVVVTDFHNHSVKVFSKQGKHKLTYGSPGNAPGQLSAPTGCCIDYMGNVLIADWGNSRIQIFDKTGTYIDKIDTTKDPLYGPQGLGLTKDHTMVVVADSGNHCLKLFKHPLIEPLPIRGDGV